MQVRKYYKSLKQAERKQQDLYSKFPYVILVSSPLWTEEGLYIWDVSM